MTPLEYVTNKLDCNAAVWDTTNERRLADALCILLTQVAKRSARHFPNGTGGDFVREVRMLESDLLNYLFPFVVSTLSHSGDVEKALERLSHRIEMYYDLAAEDAKKEQAA